MKRNYKDQIYMFEGDKDSVYLSNVVTDPDIQVGEHTYYNDFLKDPRDFQKNNVLYHHPEVYHDKIVIGKNLLSSDADFTEVATIVHDATAQYDDGETAIIFMGHGTEHDSNSVYPKMQETFNKLGYENYYIGTVEAEPSLEDVVQAAKDGGYKKVVLEALMIVCGDHANNDMAGDEEDSWKSTFEAEGFEVECILKGLGEFEGIQQLIVQHAQESMAEAGF